MTLFSTKKQQVPADHQGPSSPLITRVARDGNPTTSRQLGVIRTQCFRHLSSPAHSTTRSCGSAAVLPCSARRGLIDKRHMPLDGSASCVSNVPPSSSSSMAKVNKTSAIESSPLTSAEPGRRRDRDGDSDTSGGGWNDALTNEPASITPVRTGTHDGTTAWTVYLTFQRSDSEDSDHALDRNHPHLSAAAAIGWSFLSGSDKANICKRSFLQANYQHYFPQNLCYLCYEPWTKLVPVSFNRQITCLPHPCRAHVVLLLCIVIALHRMHKQGSMHASSVPHWQWDHNIYLCNQQPASSNRSSKNHHNYSTNLGRALQSTNLLVAQIAGSPTLRTLAEISSRPNRAYSRHWGCDYVLYSRSESILTKECFDKVDALKAIIDQQLALQQRQEQLQQQLQQHEDQGMQQQEQQDSSSMVSSSSPRSDFRRNHGSGTKNSVVAAVQYDIVALFPPDTIITNLDYDLLRLIPNDHISPSHDNTDDGDSSDNMNDAYPLLAMAGWDSNHRTSVVQSQTDVVLFNLRHPYAPAVVNLWSEWSQPNGITCGANNDLHMLVLAIDTVRMSLNSLHKDNANGSNNNKNNNKTLIGRSWKDRPPVKLNALIIGLEETSQGYVGGVLETATADANASDGSTLNTPTWSSFALNKNYYMKGIPPGVPSSRALMLTSDLPATRMTLHKTADAVCYRYYPRCEVVAT